MTRMAGFFQGGVEQCCTKIWKLGQSEGTWQMQGKNQSWRMEQVVLMEYGVGKDVSQVLCKLFSKLFKQRLRKTKDLATLT